MHAVFSASEVPRAEGWRPPLERAVTDSPPTEPTVKGMASSLPANSHPEMSPDVTLRRNVSRVGKEGLEGKPPFRHLCCLATIKSVLFM